MKPVVTAGVILRVRDYRETDRLVTIYTRELGKVTAIARHALKSRRRFGTLLNPLQLVEVTIKQRPHRTLVFLEKARPLVALTELNRQWRLVAVACFVIDALTEMTRDHSANVPLFEATYQALFELNRGLAWQRVITVFFYRLLDHSGFRPSILDCVVCQHSINEQEMSYWVASAGGTHCASCRPAMLASIPLTDVQRQQIQKMVCHDADMTELPANRDDDLGLTLFYESIQSHLNHELRSWRFAKEMGLVENRHIAINSLESRASL